MQTGVMTIHVNIGEAKSRLSELIAAALRGEEVVLARAGVPTARIVPVDAGETLARQALAVRRMAAVGLYRQKYADVIGREAGAPAMTDAEADARFERKFGAIAG